MTNQDRRDWIRETLERFEPALVRYARRLFHGDLDRARDCVQETFLALCRQDRARVEPHLREWLFTVCRNRALDVHAKEQPMKTLDPQRSEERLDDAPDPAGLAETKDTTRRILELVAKLPPNQREVLRLKFEHGLSYREIAGVTKLTVSNVGFLIHQGMKRLKERLAHEWIEEVGTNRRARMTEETA